MRWRRFGGMEHGLTLDDCMNQPEWLLHDFDYIISEIEKQRRRRPKKKKGKNGKKQTEPQALEDLPPGLRDIVFAKLNEEKNRDKPTAISQQ